MFRGRKIRRVIWLALPVAAAALAAVVALSSIFRLRIVDFAPVGGRNDVPITAPIRITFSQPMDKASVEARLQIEPEVPGRLVWDGREATFQPHSALAPDTAYMVTLEAGAASQRGRSLNEDRSWQFRTRAPRLVYLGRPFPGAGHRQLFVTSLDGGQPLQLSDHAGGVWDYAVHPLGETIIYTALREDGGSDLWRVNPDGEDRRLLLACPGAACLAPAWSPDGEQLAYERRDIWAGAPNLDPQAGRIWLLDLEQGDDHPLFDYDVPLHSPVWAPAGERLAYASPLLPGVEVYDLRTEELYPFSNQWGAAPAWSPDGNRLVMPELMLAGESLVVRLVRADVGQEAVVDISGGDEADLYLVKDGSPAWSPGGGWIAFGRQYLDEERWTPGRQIWLARPDGTEAYSLFSAPMGDHFAFAWRPDGAALAYAYADLSQGQQPVPDVSIRVFDLVQREVEFAASDGVLPRWCP
jgi:Tol biopolymer transport system component